MSSNQDKSELPPSNTAASTGTTTTATNESTEKNKDAKKQSISKEPTKKQSTSLASSPKKPHTTASPKKSQDQTSTTNIQATTNTPTPSIEQYTNLKNQLTQQILQKQELDNKLNKLESEIYDKENEYFNESTFGNIVKGFENFSKTSGGGLNGSNKKKITYTDDDHIFSLSSNNFVKTLMKRQGLHVPSSTSSNQLNDLDEYEDSVDPSMNNKLDQSSNGGSSSGNAVASMVAASASISASGTPGRKRKARVIED